MQMLCCPMIIAFKCNHYNYNYYNVCVCVCVWVFYASTLKQCRQGTSKEDSGGSPSQFLLAVGQRGF